MDENTEKDDSRIMESMEVDPSSERQRTNNIQTADQVNPSEENHVTKLTLHPSRDIIVQDSQYSGSMLHGKMYNVTWTGDMGDFPSIGDQNLGKSVLSVTGNKENGTNNGDKDSSFPCGGHRPFPRPGTQPPPNIPIPDIKFKDCGGLDKQINYLKTAVLNPFNEVKQPNNQLKRFGLDPPKGVLFYGLPGTGKTRLAQALGNELAQTLGRRVHFIYRKGKDVACKYFGMSSQNLRAVFDEAKANQPCILFFDELDGLCPNRDKAFMNQGNITIVTTMLGLMDELPKGRVIVIGATNRLDAIDPALRRPGRFDKYLEFLPPNEEGRLSILTIHTKKWKVQPNRNLLQWLSQRTVGFTGADLSKLSLDAFDSALLRALANHKNSNGTYVGLSTIDLSSLSVSEEDWKSAFEKMKPSNSAVFGSSLYIPPPSIGTHVEPLIQDDAEKIKNLLLKLFSDGKTAQASEHSSKVRSLYVWASATSSSVCTNEVVLSEVLKTQEVNKHHIYCISQDILESIPKRDWSIKVKNTFTQALSAGDSILYIQNIKSLCDLIRISSIGLALNMQQQLERLRGTQVVLLASGSKNLSGLCAGNPFRKFLLNSSDTCYEVANPSEDKRRKFFEPLFVSLMIYSKRKLTKDDVMALTTVQEVAVSVTNNKDIGDILQLHDSIVYGKATTTDDIDNPTFMSKLLKIVSS